MYVYTIMSTVHINLYYSPSRYGFNLASELARIHFDLGLVDQHCYNGL